MVPDRYFVGDLNEENSKRESRGASYPTGDPIEIAKATLFLASDEGSFISGAVIPVDGGWMSF